MRESFCAVMESFVNDYMEKRKEEKRNPKGFVFLLSPFLGTFVAV